MDFNMLLPKIFVALILLIYCSAIYIYTKRTPLLYIGGAVCLILIRDIIYVFFPNPFVILTAEVGVLGFYLGWLRLFTEKKSADIPFIIINALVLLLVLGDIIFQVLPDSFFIINLLLLVNVFYLAIVFSLVSPFNTENSQVIQQTRFILMAGLFLVYLIMLLFGYSHPYIHTIFLPLSYFIHGYVLLRLFLNFNDEEKKLSNFYAQNLESMFQFMEKLGTAITTKLDLPEVLNIIVNSTVKNIKADAGAIFLVDEFGELLYAKAFSGVYPLLFQVPDIAQVSPASMKRYFLEHPIPVGETIIGEAAQQGKPIYIRDSRDDPRLEINKNDDILFISSVIVVPLIVNNRVLGVLSIIKRAENQFFDERDYLHAKTFADYTSITINNIYTYQEIMEKKEMEQEVDIAARIQKKLLPGTIPEMLNASLAVYNKPAKGISGDFYDIIQLDKNRVALLVCDVAGKGIPAALIMVMIRSILHLVVTPDRDPATVIRLINRGIGGSIDMDNFATLVYMIYDQEKKTLIYSNAAHLPLMVYKKNINRLHKVDTTGLPLGIEKDLQWSQKNINMDSGDIVILCTDGVVEAMNPEGKQYTVTRLRKIIEQNTKLSSDRLIKKIEYDLSKFVKNARQHDDQTIMIMKTT